MRVAILCCIPLVVLGLSACDEPIAVQRSPVEGIPIPERAEPVPSTPGGYRVRGMSYSRITAWYDQQLPKGRAWGDWAWCETSTGNTFDQRTYHRPGSREILTVVIIVGDPPGILIGRDQSGPCT
jgi:hypothetical protein